MVEILGCEIGRAVETSRAVMIPATCTAWIGLKKVIEVPTGIIGVGPVARRLALR